jgi:hypothetical protein
MEVKTQILETVEKMPLSLQKELLNYAQYLEQKIEYNLDELLDQEIEIREEIDWGIPEGGEIW